MNWGTIASAEWRRRPVRSSVAAAGIAVATAAMFSLLSFQQGYRSGVKSELDRLGAHILVVPKGCPYDAASMALHGASWPCYLKQSHLDEVRGVIGAGGAAPVLMCVAGVKNEDSTVYAGINSDFLSMRPGWKIHGSFLEEPGTLLAGAEAARRHGWSLGARVDLPGLTNHSAVVAGILDPSHSSEDAFVYMRLPDTQQLFGHTNELTHILIRLADPKDLDRAASQLRGCDAGMTLNIVPLAHVFRTIQSLVDSTRWLLGSIAIIAFLIAGSGVTNSVLMAVAERTREIGVMRSFGASRSQVFGLVCAETAQMASIGAVAGIGIAFAASHWVDGWVRSELPFAPTGKVILWDWRIAAICVLCALVFGLAAAILPAARAAAIPPALAIKSARGAQ